MTRFCSIEGCGRPVHKRGWCNGHYARWRRHGDVMAGVPLAARARNGEPLRWLLDHAGYQGDDCLTWPFGRDDDGYGGIWHEGAQQGAHRMMCEIVHGPPPTPAHQAIHSCGNGHLACINPNHIDWGTPKQNKADELAHGTRNRGEARWSAKLTEEQVRQIRRMKGTMLPREIADIFGVSRRQISGILNRQTWAWLD